MKAAVLRKPEVLELADIPPFTLEPGMVSVRVEACGICGSDLRYFNGENPWALHTLGAELPNPPNIVLGHEFAGTVEKAASRDGEKLIGKRVAVLCFQTCGECGPCKSGLPNLCNRTKHLGHGAGWGERDYYPGGMAELCPAWAAGCIELPPSVSSEEAALLDVVGVGVHAVGVGNVQPGMTVAVLGVGPIGNAILQVARAAGAERVFATDVYDVALALARKAEATLVVDSRHESVVERVRAATRDRGCHVVFDTVGSDESLGWGLDLLAEGGTLVNMAVHAGTIRVNSLALGGERAIRTSCNFAPEEYPRALSLVASGAVKVRPWITHRFPLDDVQRAFDVGLNKERYGAFKVMLFP